MEIIIIKIPLILNDLYPNGKGLVFNLGINVAIRRRNDNE